MTDEGPPLSPEARAALEQERARTGLTAEEVARLRERVERARRGASEVPATRAAGGASKR